MRQNLKAYKKVDISPGTCAVCGLASQPMPISKTIYWHSTWLYLLVFNLLVYAIAAVILRYKIVCQFELCEEHQRRRTRAIRQAWIVIPLALISPFLLAQILSGEFLGFVVLLFVLGIVFSCLFGHYRSRVIWSVGMTKDYAWFGGVSKEYLTSLPTWTGSARPGANAAFIASIVVAIPILGVLIGLLLPAIQQARRAAQRSAEEKVSLPQQAPLFDALDNEEKTFDFTTKTETSDHLQALVENGSWLEFCYELIDRMLKDEATEIWIYPGQQPQLVRDGEPYQSIGQSLPDSAVKNILTTLNPSEVREAERFLISARTGFYWGKVIETSDGFGLIIQDFSADSFTPQAHKAKESEAVMEDPFGNTSPMPRGQAEPPTEDPFQDTSPIPRRPFD